MPQNHSKETAHYYSQEVILKYLFRHTENRGLNMRIFDELYHEKGFQHSLHGLKTHGYLKSDLPEWVERNLEPVYTASYDREVPYYICKNKKLLNYFIHDFPLTEGLFLMEVHSWLSRSPEWEYPDYAIINLRPDKEQHRFQYLIDAALAAREIITVPSYIKISEEQGLHIYIPLKKQFKYEFAKKLVLRIAEEIHEKCKDITLLKPIRSGRNGRVLLDVSQNNNKGSVIAPYSLIAGKDRLVAAPLKWEEVNASLDPSKFTSGTILKRLEEVGDIFEPLTMD